MFMYNIFYIPYNAQHYRDLGTPISTTTILISLFFSAYYTLSASDKQNNHTYFDSSPIHSRRYTVNQRSPPLISLKSPTAIKYHNIALHHITTSHTLHALHSLCPASYKLISLYPYSCTVLLKPPFTRWWSFYYTQRLFVMLWYNRRPHHASRSNGLNSCSRGSGLSV